MGPPRYNNSAAPAVEGGGVGMREGGREGGVGGST